MRRTFILCLLFFVRTAFGADDSPTLKSAREHLQQGRYEEAIEAFDALEKAKQDPVQIALGRSRAYHATGDWQPAIEILEAAVKANEKNAALRARLAEVFFLKGRYDDAKKLVDESLKLDTDQPLARLVQADLYTETGQIKQALETYRWFVRYYNRAQPNDPETLVLIARGAAQYARWKRVTQIFGFAINELCPDALKKDRFHWQALYISGSLLLEKYNEGQAVPDLDRALAINPRATPVLVARGSAALQDAKLKEAKEFADRALAVDSKNVEALQLSADIRVASGQLVEARQLLEQALAVNPNEQRTLGRLAACNLLEDGLPSDEEWNQLFSHFESIDKVSIASPSRFSQVAIDVAKRNPHPGYFLNIAASALEQQRRFEPAERLYRQAIASMPELSEPRAALAMLYMSMGKTDEATKLLDEALEADPFHIRVSNMRKVAGLLKGYETISTDHFVIHFDTGHDKVLARYLADYLEEIYPELVKQFGYEPQQRTQFEIYHDAKGLTAHQWFSARMVGLPWIQTIGASTGMIVALASPTAAEKPYNWARVVKHEFVHIITLQQTSFKIPHWFTEALAVQAEGFERPAIWNELLLQRVPKGNLRTLENLNEGFTRPESPMDWQFAYCQSRLYAQYLVEKFGNESISRLLEQYRQNVSTEKAIQQVCGVDIATFEAGYKKYLDEIVAKLGDAATSPDAPTTIEELTKAFQKSPDNPKIVGQFALALLAKKRDEKARELARQVNKSTPGEPYSAMVLAELELRAENLEAAAKYLDGALDREHPHPKVLAKLASVRLRMKDFAAVESLCELGRSKFPHEADFLEGLAAVYKKLDNMPKRKAALLELSQHDADDLEPRMQLLEIAAAEKNYADVVKYAEQLLQIDVMNEDVHRTLAEAYRETGQKDREIREYETLVTILPDDVAAALSLARCLIAAERKKDAKGRLEEFLSRHTDSKDAAELLGTLK